MTNVAVIYYSSTGHVHRLAVEAAAAAVEAGAEVRLRKVAELAPAAVVAARQEWADHAEATRDVPGAVLADLEWADVVLFGTPARFGLPAAPLKQFIDTTGGLWFQGRLVDKVVSSFTSSSTLHGGQESTLLALNTTFHRWGAIIVAPGYAHEARFAPGSGHPCGAGHGSNHHPGAPGPDDLAAVAHQARRSVEIATALKAGLAAV